MNDRAPAWLPHASEMHDAATMQRFRAAGLWRDRQITDELHAGAGEHPDRTAVFDGRRRVSWGELDVRARRIAAALVADGLQPGEFVAIQLPNWTEAIEVFLGVQLAGLRPLTIMPLYRDRDVVHMLRTCRAAAYVIPDEYRRFDHVALAERIADDVPSLRRTYVLGEPGRGMAALADVLPEDAPAASAFASLRLDPDAAARVSFTSGTTDLPKGVVHSHNSDLVAPLLTARAVGLSATTPIFMGSPVMHVTGLLFGLYLAMHCHTTLVILDRWDAEHALNLISRERAAFTASAATFLKDMVDVTDIASLDLDAFRVFVSGGAPTAPSVMAEARERLGLTVLRSFGQSEAPLHALNCLGDSWDVLTSRDGKVFDGLAVRISDPHDPTRELAPGEVGEYATKGPHVFLGYVDDPKQTAEARTADGWYFSGDLCFVDEDGYVAYVDRSKDIINRGGVKISALEVEHALAAHPTIAAAAVVAMPDARLVERACAFVRLRDGERLTLNELNAFLQQAGVTTQKWPERLEIVDQLPTTSTGKVQKNLLRERARQLRAS